MAISKEDKKDVKGAFGKAIANKIEKATRDYGPKASRHVADLPANKRRVGDGGKYRRGLNDMKSGNYRALKPLGGEGKATNFASYKPDKTHDQFKKESHKGYSVFPSNSKYQ